ncbi:hypothetical protein KIN20_034856 [Parelaphostrongylus tenuis]|uniref:Uncharacterized protein n=1 Tax=Parelaphostrongylus tenuis TaxID=148309 RepID=A0AAD5WKD6_PARTN|nr:hypothetical protein KIN20_034856 [Parelaphostrongylus tenuis]
MENYTFGTIALPIIVRRRYLETVTKRRGESKLFGCSYANHFQMECSGRPVLQPNGSVRSEILITMCDVRRGKFMHRWSRHRCLLYNGIIRIQKKFVQVFELRDMENLMHKMRVSKISCQLKICDLSDRKLTLLPESLFSAVQLGWLDDLSRLSSLTFLDLSSNRLSTFPASLAQLANLERLDMSSNFIQTLPSNVKFMKRLRSCNLENNWISTLPSQLAECEQLKCLNLKFNRIKQVPIATDMSSTSVEKLDHLG